MHGFHWRDGWFFRREDDGSVCIFQVREPFEFRPFTSVELNQDMVEVGPVTIPAAEWVSIVTAVSAGGETYHRHIAADDFHSGVGCAMLLPVNANTLLQIPCPAGGALAWAPQARNENVMCVVKPGDKTIRVPGLSSPGVMHATRLIEGLQ